MRNEGTTLYCCTFAFSPDLSHVVLIRKARPEWQAGKLNGIGGHLDLEARESGFVAARREFREETGVDIEQLDCFLGFGGNHFHIYCYCARLTEEQLVAVRAMTDEPIEIHEVGALPDSVIPNIRWMIPMALNHLTGDDGTFHQTISLWPEEVQRMRELIAY